MDDLEGDRIDALRILIKTGVLAECEFHPGSYFDGGEEIESAYKLANARITSGELSLRNGQTRRELTDAIKGVYDDNSALDGCPSCDKAFAD